MGNFPVSYALSPGFNLHQSNVKVVQQLLTVIQAGFFYFWKLEKKGDGLRDRTWDESWGIPQTPFAACSVQEHHELRDLCVSSPS